MSQLTAEIELSEALHHDDQVVLSFVNPVDNSIELIEWRVSQGLGSHRLFSIPQEKFASETLNIEQIKQNVDAWIVSKEETEVQQAILAQTLVPVQDNVYHDVGYSSIFGVGLGLAVRGLGLLTKIPILHSKAGLGITAVGLAGAGLGAAILTGTVTPSDFEGIGQGIVRGITDLIPGRSGETPSVTPASRQSSAQTRGSEAVTQDYSKYAKYLTTLTFPTEDPDYGWKAHKGGKVEAYLAEFYGATGEDDAFNPHRDALSYEERKAADSEHFANRYNAGLEFFKKLNAGLGSYPDDDPWVHIRSSENKVVDFNSLTREGWKEFFEAHGGEYVPQATGTPAQAEPAATAPAPDAPTPQPQSRGRSQATGVDSSRPDSFECPTPIQNRENLVQRAKTEDCLIQALKDAGIAPERLTINNVEDATHYIDLIKLASKYGLTAEQIRQMFPVNEIIKMGALKNGEKVWINARYVDKALVNTSQGRFSIDEIVYLIHQDGRFILIRELCVNPMLPKVEIKVPVASPTSISTPTPTLVPGQLAIPVAAPLPSATLMPPRGQETIVQPAPTQQPRFEAPTAPRTYEQLPSPVQAFISRTLPPGQQAIIKLFDTNNNGICDPGDLPPQNVEGVVFAIEFLSPRDGFLTPERRIVYTNSSGVALGDFRPSGEPFRVVEFVRGERPLYAQPYGRAGQFGVSVFDPNRAVPAVFCNGRESTSIPTPTPTPTGTPRPTGIPTLPGTPLPIGTPESLPTPPGQSPTRAPETATATPPVPTNGPIASPTVPPATATREIPTATRGPEASPTVPPLPTPSIPPQQPTNAVPTATREIPTATRGPEASPTVPPLPTPSIPPQQPTNAVPTATRGVLPTPTIPGR